MHPSRNHAKFEAMKELFIVVHLFTKNAYGISIYGEILHPNAWIFTKSIYAELLLGEFHVLDL